MPVSTVNPRPATPRGAEVLRAFSPFPALHIVYILTNDRQ